MLQCAFPYDKIVKNTKFFHPSHKIGSANLIDVFYRYAHKCATKNQIFALFRRILCPKLSINCSNFLSTFPQKQAPFTEIKIFIIYMFQSKKACRPCRRRQPSCEAQEGCKELSDFLFDRHGSLFRNRLQPCGLPCRRGIPARPAGNQLNGARGNKAEHFFSEFTERFALPVRDLRSVDEEPSAERIAPRTGTGRVKFSPKVSVTLFSVRLPPALSMTVY